MRRERIYVDRIDAGRKLARHLAERKHELGLDGGDVVVVGLPRGGLPVASEVAIELGAPLDVILVRKLGVPFQPEVAMGAIGEGGVRVISDHVVEMAGITPDELAAVERRERMELERRAARYRSGRPRHVLTGRVVVIVDDGIATGATARAACQVARAHNVARLILAMPVAPPDWVERLGSEADELVTLLTPAFFHSVGQFYRDFSQTTDDDVVEILGRAVENGAPEAGRDEDVTIRIGDKELGGHLTVPAEAKGLVIFAHGSGSSRHSPRNRLVAEVLNEAGLATLLFDLLTPHEETDRANVFDIELLGHRLGEVTEQVRADPGLGDLAIGFFGSSTGAAAALHAAAELGSEIAAVVSRGGRPDLAASVLHTVVSPTLLIVGGADTQVLELNERAKEHMSCEARLDVIPGATHLFEEPGALEATAQAAALWFVAQLQN